ncbi:hypothetical protein PQX77_014419 [Marasmius sp. AFHP31]|nr:hypothetical protein PQX77_014419 [Marasmius sp. AFHP31]
MHRGSVLLLYSQLYAATFAIPVAHRLSDPCTVSRVDVPLEYSIIETGGAIKCEHLHSSHYPPLPADIDDMGYPLEAVNDAKSERSALTVANSQTGPEFVQLATGSAPQVWKRNSTRDLRHRALERRRKSDELDTGAIAAISVAVGGSALCIIFGAIARLRHPRGGGSGDGGGGGGGDGGGDGGGGCGGDGGGGGGDGGC